jgi:hypothetical protein
VDQPSRWTSLEGVIHDRCLRRRPLTLRNRLLLALGPDDREVVLAQAEFLSMSVGDVVQEVMTPPTHVLFPNDGLGSFVAVMEDGSMVEAASVGIDGFIGAPVVLGAGVSTGLVIWQVPGSAYRIPVAPFLELLREGRFGSVLGTYLQQMADQMTQVAGCNRRHVIVKRAARWLLMTHDRVTGDEFLLTHEFLATMLGAGRPKVTLAAQRLQELGLISYRRGIVTIRDRPGLEAAACECYPVLARTFPGSGSPAGMALAAGVETAG